MALQNATSALHGSSPLAVQVASMLLSYLFTPIPHKVYSIYLGPTYAEASAAVVYAGKVSKENMKRGAAG